MKPRIFFLRFVFASIVLISNGNSCQLKIPNKNEERIVIPLDLTSQRPIVEVRINGKGPFRFIFDTGSSGNVIDENLAKTLELIVIGEDPLRTPGSDNKLMSKRVRVSSVNVVGADISEDVIMNTIALREMLPVDGILSTDFFSEYLIQIDYPNSELVLTKSELSAGDSDVISYIQNPRVINIDVHVADNKIEAHLDSGNPGGFDIPYSLKDKLTFKDEPVEAGYINTPVARFKKWRATLDGDIKIGNVIYQNPEINLVEGFEFVNLGYQIFKDLKIVIDKRNNLIKFERSVSNVDDEQEDEDQGESNEFTGWYGGHERRIFIEGNELFLQRGGAAKLKLVKLTEDKYKMVFGVPVMNELPIIRFERNKNDYVIGLTFIYTDGKEDFSKKDK